MKLIEILIKFLFGIYRTFGWEFLHQSTDDFKVDNLLGMSIYNFGTEPIEVFGFPLRAYDAARGPDVYVLDTMPIIYDNNLRIPIKFTGVTTTENRAYITYSALKRC